MKADTTACPDVALQQWLQDPADKGHIAQALAEARQRTWLLLDGLADADWDRPVADYLSPPNWDVGHIANFEELWLVQNLLQQGELHDGYNRIYDAFATPRNKRPALRLLSRDAARDYMDEVRQRSLAALEAVDLDATRLTRGGFVHWMIILHEHQHQETLLQSLVMLGPERYQTPPIRPLPAPSRQGSPWCDVPAGRYPIGTPQAAGVYDNESPPHEVDVAGFQIARYPVTCGEYLDFVLADGYEQMDHWSPRGRQWLQETGCKAPMYWHHDEAWHRTDLRGTSAVVDVADEVLCHITFFEAEAYASWAGARLPSETEWEVACRGPDGHRNPWGDAPADATRANIDHLGFGPNRIGAYPEGASWCGVEHMLGDVWEWTSSGWEPYAGFEAFPYKEYSEVFWGGDYQVLRGGAWSARAGCSTGTFRNWDHPYRAQIMSGIRLVRDA